MDANDFMLFKSPEQQMRHDMIQAKVVATPFKVAGWFTEQVIGLLAKIPGVDYGIAKTAKGIQTLTDKIKQTILPGDWEKRKASLRDAYLKHYGISHEETDEYFDNCNEIITNFALMGIGAGLKVGGQGLCRVSKKIYVTQMDKIKFAKAAANATQIVDKRLVNLSKGGYVRIELFYGKDRNLTCFVDMLKAHTPGKEAGIPLQAIKAIKEIAREQGAKSLDIECFVANPKLLKILQKRHGLVETFSSVKKELVDKFSVPLHSGRTTIGNLTIGKDVIPLIHLKMGLNKYDPSTPDHESFVIKQYLPTFTPGIEFWQPKPETPSEFENRSNFSYAPPEPIGATPVQPASNVIHPSRPLADRKVEPIDPLQQTAEMRKKNPKMDTDFVPKSTLNDSLSQMSNELPAIGACLAGIQDIFTDKKPEDKKDAAKESTAETPEEKKKYWEEFTKKASEIMSLAFDCIDGHEQDRELRHQISDYARQQKKHFKYLHEQLGQQRVQEYIPELRSSLNSPDAYFTKLNQLKKDYENDVRELQEYIAHSRNTRANAEKVLDRVEHLDAKGHEIYQRLIKKKLELGGALRITANCMKAAGLVLMPITGPGGAALYLGGEALGKVGGKATQKKVNRLMREQMRFSQRNQETGNRAAGFISHAMAKEARGQTGQAHMRAMDRQATEMMSFKGYQKEKADLERGVNEINEGIANTDKLSSETDQEIEKINREIQHQKKKSHKGKRKSRLQAQSKVKHLEMMLMQLQENKEDLKKQKEAGEKELKNQKEAIGRVNYSAGIRQKTADLLENYNAPKNESEDARIDREKVEGLWRDVHYHAQAHDTIWMPYNQMARNLHENSMILEQCLNKFLEKTLDNYDSKKDRHRLGAGINLLYQLWQLTDAVSRVLSVTAPAIKEVSGIMQKDAGLLETLKYRWQNTQSGAGKAALASIVVDIVIIPILRTLTIARDVYSQFHIMTHDYEPSQSEKTFNDIIERLETIQKGNADIISLLNLVQMDVVAFGDEIHRSIKEGIEKLGTRHDDRHFEELKRDIDEIKDDWKSKFAISTPSERTPLFSPSTYAKDATNLQISAHRQAKMFGWIEDLKIAHAKVIAPFNNGYSIQRQFMKDVLKLTTDHGLLHCEPQNFTGFLANRVSQDLHDNHPNLVLLNEWSRSFVSFVNTLREQPISVDDFRAIMRKDAMKKELLALCQLIKSEQDKIIALSEKGLFDSLKMMIRTRDLRIKKTQNRLARAKDIQRHHEEQSSAKALEAYDEHNLRELTLNDHFVGSKKFFLRQMIQQGEFLKDHLGNLNVREIYTKTYPKTTQVQGIAKIAVILSGLLGGYEIGREIYNKDYQPKRLAPATAGVAGAGAVLTLQPEVFGVHNYAFVKQAEKNQKQINDIALLSLNELCSMNLTQVGFDIDIDAQRGCLIYLDLINRKITHVTKKDQKQYLVVGSMHVDSGLHFNVTHDPKINIEFNPKTITKKEINAIPSSGIQQSSYSDYDQSVRLLIEDYYAFVDHKVKGVPLDQKSPFAEEADECQVVAPLDNPFLVNLVISNERLDALRDMLNPELARIEASGIGTLVHYYSFSLDDFTINIHFKFKKDINSPEQDFGSIVAERIDGLTVRSFQQALAEEKLDKVDPKKLSEMMIQFYYTGFGYKLGMPGSETYKLETGPYLVAPQLLKFPGAYKLGKMCPHTVIDFNCKHLTTEAAERLEQCRRQFEKDPDYVFQIDDTTAQLFNPFPSLKLGRDYGRVWTKLINETRTLDGLEKEFRENSFVAMAFIRLVSELNDHEVDRLFENYFAIKIHRFNDKIEPKIILNEDCSTSPVGNEVISLFISEIKQRLCGAFGEMDKLRQDIQEIESFLKSEKNVAYVPIVHKPIVLPAIPEMPVVGLKNIGFSCYISAVVQILLRTPIPKMMLHAKKSKDLAKNFIELQKSILSKNVKAIVPAIYDLRYTIFNDYGDDKYFEADEVEAQQDARQLLEMLLNVAMYKVKMVEKRGSSTKEVVQTVLNVPMVDKVTTLQRLVELSLTDEVEMKILDKPAVLFVSLKRYQWKKQGIAAKNDDPVEIPVDAILDMTKFMADGMEAKYRLIGCVDHVGASTHQGHYTASIKQENKWYFLDDDQVPREVNFEDIRNRNHYCYVFEAI